MNTYLFNYTAKQIIMVCFTYFISNTKYSFIDKFLQKMISIHLQICHFCCKQFAHLSEFNHNTSTCNIIPHVITYMHLSAILESKLIGKKYSFSFICSSSSASPTIKYQKHEICNFV